MTLNTYLNTYQFVTVLKVGNLITHSNTRQFSVIARNEETEFSKTYIISDTGQSNSDFARENCVPLLAVVKLYVSVAFTSNMVLLLEPVRFCIIGNDCSSFSIIYDNKDMARSVCKSESLNCSKSRQNSFLSLFHTLGD